MSCSTRSLESIARAGAIAESALATARHLLAGEERGSLVADLLILQVELEDAARWIRAGQSREAKPLLHRVCLCGDPECSLCALERSLA